MCLKRALLQGMTKATGGSDPHAWVLTQGKVPGQKCTRLAAARASLVITTCDITPGDFHKHWAWGLA